MLGDMETYLTASPSRALTASLVAELDDEEQKTHIGTLIANAVFCDSWEVYFWYAMNNNVEVTDDVAFEAVQSVGLDPLSANLWIMAAKSRPSAESKRELFKLGLSVPLYAADALFQEYQLFEEGEGGQLVATQPTPYDLPARWPDRYQELLSVEEKIEVRSQWMRLMEVMYAQLQEDTASVDVQKRRMDLAFRQLLVELPDDDSCWYEYCLFLMYVMGEEEAAKEYAKVGLARCGGSSFALQSVLSVLGTDDMAALGPLARQRLLAERIATATDDKKGDIRALRTIGKEAAQEGCSQWALYSQWSEAESLVVQDEKMASKVFQNGTICCSASPDDSILLGGEALRYHLLHHQERESRGYAEQIIGRQMASGHTGRTKASWNALIQLERTLGLSSSKSEARRDEHFPQSSLLTFLQKYRVDNYVPCSNSTMQWIQFTEDFSKARKVESDSTVDANAGPARGRVLQPAVIVPCAVEAPKPDVTLWSQAIPTNSVKPQQSDDPDDVVGPRELRGKLVYRIKPDRATDVRLQLEEELRQRSQTNEVLTAPDSAMAILLKRIGNLTITPEMTSRLDGISLDWVLDQLVTTELNLEEVIKARSTTNK